MAQDSPIPGYGIEAFEWDVEIAPGHIEALNGTVQEVYAQVLQINPGFQPPLDAGATMESRGLHQKRNVLCGNFPSADKGRVLQGISNLRGLGAAPRNGPGPGNCGRVSCSYKAAIWWCNDVGTPSSRVSIVVLGTDEHTQCDRTPRPRRWTAGT